MDPKFIVWQATLWDRFAKISPIILLSSIAVFYFLGFREWDLIIHLILVALISVAAAWWFWVVYTIAIIAMALNKSNKKLVDVLNEIKRAQKDIHELRPRDRKRREP